MRKKLLMCFAMLFMCVSAALAQTKISGTVVSADDNERLSRKKVGKFS